MTEQFRRSCQFVLGTALMMVGSSSFAAYFDENTARSEACSAGFRWHTVRMQGGSGGTWADDCWKLPRTINGVNYERPHYCVDYGGNTGTWAEYAVRDSSCGPVFDNWNNYTSSGYDSTNPSISGNRTEWREPQRLECGTNAERDGEGGDNSGAAGFRKYYLQLNHPVENYTSSLAACANWPIDIGGVRFGYERDIDTAKGFRACFPKGGATVTDAYFWVRDKSCDANQPRSPARGSDSGVTTSLKGFADLHSHPFAYKAFGGGVYGSARGTVESAFGNHNNENTEGGHRRMTYLFKNLTSTSENDVTIQSILTANQGNELAYDETEAAGYPTFKRVNRFSQDEQNTWPRVWGDTHAQMHNAWLRQANLGGMRLMVAYANNHGLNHNGDDSDETRLPDIAKGAAQVGAPVDLNGDGLQNKADLDDWTALLNQTSEAHKMAQEHSFVELPDDANDARVAVDQGKLAMVWGSEIDQAFNCKAPWSKAGGASTAKVCDKRDIDEAIMVHEMLKIRSVFPIHIKANGLGAPAHNSLLVFQGPRWFDGYEFCKDQDGQAGYNDAGPVVIPFQGVCASGGLTDLGRYAILSSWAMGHAVEVGHMGINAFDQALTLAEDYDVPVVHGHANAHELKRFRDEGQTGREQFKRIAATDGMVGVIGQLGHLNEFVPYVDSTVWPRTGGTAQAWASVYEYLRDLDPNYDVHQQGGENVGKVALGLDMNGGITTPVGRFQYHWATDRDQRTNAWYGTTGNRYIPRVQYDYPLPPTLTSAYCEDSEGDTNWAALCDESNNRWTRRTQPKALLTPGNLDSDSDYNERGLNTIASIPDFVEDMRVTGMPLKKLESFYNTAMGYVKTWEDIEQSAKSDVYWFKNGLENDARYTQARFPLRKVPSSTPADNGNLGFIRQFDFGTNTSPLAPEHQRVTRNSGGEDYGWNDNNGLNDLDRGDSTNANLIQRDLVFSNQTRTFQASVPNGNYRVRITIGDTYLHDNMVIKAEGEVKASDVDRAVNQYADEVFLVAVTDGELNIEFSDAGGVDANWVVNAIAIEQTDDSVGGNTQVQLPVLLDFGTVSSPLFSGYERVHQTTNNADYGWVNASGNDSRDRGSSPQRNLLNRDLVFNSIPREFRVKLLDGSYQVVVTMGDSFPHDNMVIKAEGTTVASNIDRAANQFANEIFTVNITDGELNLEFSDQGGNDPNWVVTRVLVNPLQ